MSDSECSSDSDFGDWDYWYLQEWCIECCERIRYSTIPDNKTYHYTITREKGSGEGGEGDECGVFTCIECWDAIAAKAHHPTKS